MKNMQKTALILGCLVLLNWACGQKKTTEEVTTEVTAQKTEVMKATEKFESARAALSAKVDAMGSSVKDLPDTSFLSRVIGGSGRFDKAREDAQKLTQELDQLSADYAAGKVEKKEYEERYKKLMEDVEKFVARASRMEEGIQQAIK